MEVVCLSYPIQSDKINLKETVAAIGFFDGIHKGHQKVIYKAKQLAEQQNRKSAVITFLPHPSVVLNKNKQTVHYLTPLPEKKEILAEMGIDILYIISFNQTLAALSPNLFVDHFIVGLDIKHLVTGFDFTYGHKGKGNVHTLASDADGQFELTVIEKLEEEDQKISSTRIRQLLANGSVEQIIPLMGRPLTTAGEVIEGEKRGRQIGYPTANVLPSKEYAIPKRGVYAVKVWYKEHLLYGMANVGYKPTFHVGQKTEQPTVEVHLFDFNKAIYGEKIRIEWHKYIRDERQFDGIDHLTTQLQEDEQVIRQFFSSIQD